MSDACRDCEFLEYCEGYGYPLDQEDQLGCEYYSMYYDEMQRQALEGD